MANNNIATIHLLTKEESVILRTAYEDFLIEIEVIKKRAELPFNSVWMPSADFKWLVKQGD